MAGMFFFQVYWPLEWEPTGEVVVLAPKGVAELLWMPVFM
jgi:hypothetical protein